MGPLSTRGKLEKARSWGADYIQARLLLHSQPLQACASFQRLATEPSVSISPLAAVRSLENCQASNMAQAVSTLDQMHGDSALAWLQPVITEAIVNMALASQNNPAIVKYAFARSRQLGAQREKENLLLAAIAAARTLNLPVKAAEFESELYRGSPRLKPNPPENEWLKVGDDYRANEDWANALATYERIAASPRSSPMEHFRALNGIREVHKAKFRFYEGPLADFMRASERTATYAEEKVLRPGNLSFDDRRVLFEAWTQYARDEWSYGDVAIALQQIHRILAVPTLDPVFRSHAYWTLSRIHANNSDWRPAAEAGELSAGILESDLANSAQWSKWQWTLWDDALWTASLANRKSQDMNTAAALLDLALRYTKNANAELKFLFWLAQSLKDQGLGTVAVTYFQKLAALDPYGFYGFLAHRDLQAELTALPDLDLENAVKPASVSEADFDLLLGLKYADELSLAQKFSQRILNPASVAPEELFLRAFVHDYVTIQALVFSRIPLADRNAFIAKYARLFYPRPFHDLVAAAVTRNPRIDEEYVYSIMRQESGFNPLSHSWANAYGLLQLLPQVARDTQAKAGVTFQEDFELYRPEINIPIGVAHMDDLVDRAGSSFILRTASYNAQFEKVLEWHQRLYTGNVYEFMEEIPYEETRSYIRLVMRNYIMNLRLGATQPLEFPESVLSL